MLLGETISMNRTYFETIDWKMSSFSFTAHYVIGAFIGDVRTKVGKLCNYGWEHWEYYLCHIYINGNGYYNRLD